MSSDPDHRSNGPESDAEAARAPESPADPGLEKPSPAEAEQPEAPTAEQDDAEALPSAGHRNAPPNGRMPEARPRRRRILIGSQRNPDAYRPKPKRDWTPVVDEQERSGHKAVETVKDQAAPETAAGAQTASPTEPAVGQQEASPEETVLCEPLAEQIELPKHGRQKRFPPPNIRDRLPSDLEDEFQEALADVPLDELMAGGQPVTGESLLEPKSRHTARVVAVRREDVFVELGGREQGILPLKQFSQPPQVGAVIEVRVAHFNPEDGLYELALPDAAADVGDWSDLEEGILVEARVTGHNSGGLECEVNHIRGFIPVSQISLYHVEDLAQFVDQKFTCLVTEANPRRRNLVLSRRAVLEREKQEARKRLLNSLAPGQIHEGVVRKLVDFGAFVDLGGVEGLLHISQLSWARVDHPRDVLQEGQTIKVRLDKVDTASGRISLSYRHMLENPWTDAEKKYPPNTTVSGKVTKLMEFGAFVELEPGVEGLVHISELSHKRVGRVSEVVNEGDQIQAVVLSVDAEAQRIGLSMKDFTREPEPAAEEKPGPAEKHARPPKRPKKPSKPLKGGLGRSPGGERSGLKW